MSEDVTELQKSIVSLILSNNRRPSAIAAILKRKHPQSNQNLIIQALVDLEKRGFVERSTSKAWIAKTKAANLIES